MVKVTVEAEIKVVDACVECGGTSFTDLPTGSATARWGAEHEHPHCTCDGCGAWYWQDAIEPQLRNGGPDVPVDGNYRNMFRDLRENSKKYRAREIASLKAKTSRLEAKEAAKGDVVKGVRQ